MWEWVNLFMILLLANNNNSCVAPHFCVLASHHGVGSHPTSLWIEFFSLAFFGPIEIHNEMDANNVWLRVNWVSPAIRLNFNHIFHSHRGPKWQWSSETEIWREMHFKALVVSKTRSICPKTNWLQQSSPLDDSTMHRPESTNDVRLKELFRCSNNPRFNYSRLYSISIFYYYLFDDFTSVLINYETNEGNANATRSQ